MRESPHPALLVLEDGTVHRGRSIGAQGETFGELVFNTGMTGYQEVLTDPSYRGQIVVMTYPEIGVYGVNWDDVESGEIQVAGFAVHRAVDQPFNQRADLPFTDYLAQADIVAVEGIDTRALTRHLRTQGAMRGAISTEDLNVESLVSRVRQSPKMQGRNLAQAVTTGEPFVETDSGAYHVVLIDAGLKRGIVRHLVQRGASVTVLPYDQNVDDAIAANPDGVLVSNGPGDPAVLDATIALMRDLMEKGIPLAGICLGHQLLGLAVGGTTYKMRFGHRGANHPVKRMNTDRVLITTQNHGFAVDPTSLGMGWRPLDAAFKPQRPSLLDDEPPCEDATMAEMLPDAPLTGESPLGFGPVEATHLSLNDGTLEGLRLLDLPAFSVQFHPEASPGPHDAAAFFDRFADMIKEERGDHA